MVNTLIFDGDCGFCTTTANFIEKHTKSPMEIHPWQFIDSTKYGLTVEQVADRVFFIVDGKAYGGHDAFGMLLRVQPNPLLKAVGWLTMVPPFSWLAKPGYRLVAKYRHKLPGGTPACKLPR